MSFLILKHSGLPFAVVTGGSINDVEKHVRNGWPNLIEVLTEITGEVMADASAVVLSSPPETPKGLADAFERKSFLVAFDHENRLRKLEAKPQITRRQFIAAITAL